jgi:hypothetical protein
MSIFIFPDELSKVRIAKKTIIAYGSYKSNGPLPKIFIDTVNTVEEQPYIISIDIAKQEEVLAFIDVQIDKLDRIGVIHKNGNTNCRSIF